MGTFTEALTKGLGSGVAGVATGALNGILSILMGEHNAAMQHKYFTKQADYTFGLNEKSADNAMNRQINLFNQLQSPQAIKQQLINAGLNPALMYSQGGMGGTVASAPQGGGGGSPTGVSALGLQNFIDPLTKAKIENINADTENKEADTENKEQDTKVKQAQEEYTKAQTLWTQIRTDIDNNNLTISNATIQEQITDIKTKTASALEELERQKRQNEIDEELYETRIKQIKQDYANSVSQGLIMEQEIEKLKAVTENVKWDTEQKQEEIKKIKWECKILQQEISNIINDTNLKYVKTLTEQEQQNYLRTLQENITKEFEAKYGWTLTKEDAFRMGEGVVNAVGTICGITTGSAVVGAMTPKKPPIGFKP